MEFRNTLITEANEVMKIIIQAQFYFKNAGINQWQNNYPNGKVIKEDIDKKGSYVLVRNNKIIATIAMFFEEEKTYKFIYDGSWLSNEKYAVIHRIAINDKLKGLGLGSIVIKNIEKLCITKGVHSIKADTHEDNISMQHLLLKNGFKYCGIIYLDDKSKRLAYEKIIQ